MFFNKLINRKIAAYQNDLMDRHYTEVENMYKKMRGWRHDYRNHIQTLKTLMAQGNYEKVNSYLDELGDDLTSVDTVLKTGNVMADAILNSKISLALSHDIPVDATATIPVEINISDIDLCVIIGNLLDNAIEASLEVPEECRSIRIYIEMKKNNLYLCFTNITATGKRTFINGRLASTKNDSGTHGFGLMRVDSIVEKYNGYISRASEDGVFSTEILIPCNCH